MFPNRGRTGLSELMAVVLLMVITLVAGFFLYQYYFSQAPNTQQIATSAESFVNSVVNSQGNNFEATAQVSASLISCSNSNGVCVIDLTNTGTANTLANACVFSGPMGGQGSLSPPSSEVVAGSSTRVNCATQSSQGSGMGAPVSGSVLLSNGASVQ